MELWIRSQDRKRLIKSNGVDLSTSELSIYTVGVNEVLGTYETKERVLEVIDDIQDKLTNCTFAKKQNFLGETVDFLPNSIYVYAMPKE